MQVDYERLGKAFQELALMVKRMWEDLKERIDQIFNDASSKRDIELPSPPKLIAMKCQVLNRKLCFARIRNSC